MATKGTIESPDALVICSVCLENFEDPRILPCGHTYCFKCISAISGPDTESIRCPKRCQSRIKMYSKKNKCTTADLPVNYDLKSLLEKIEEQGKEDDVLECIVHSMPMQGFCNTCSSFVCFACITPNGVHYLHNTKLVQDCKERLKKEVSEVDAQATHLTDCMTEGVVVAERQVKELTELIGRLQRGVEKINNVVGRVKEAQTSTQRWDATKVLKRTLSETQRTSDPAKLLGVLKHFTETSNSKILQQALDLSRGGIRDEEEMVAPAYKIPRLSSNEEDFQEKLRNGYMDRPMSPLLPV